jgi:hypothetical protein
MLVTLFLDMPYRLAAFFSAYIASSINLSIGVYIYIEVIGGVVLLQVLLAIVIVYKIDI